MKIDLSKVIEYSKDCMLNRARLRAIMMDMYPDEVREINILLAIYDSDILNEIKRRKTISGQQYALYIQRIVDEYGIQEQYARMGLDAWIDICIELGYVNRIDVSNIESNDYSIDEEAISVRDALKQEKFISKSPSGYEGTSTNYQIKAVGELNVEIVKFVGFDKKTLIIPNIIDGKNVIGIGESAFDGCKTIKKIIIAEGITYIEDRAFAMCSQLKEIILPGSLKRIGSIDHSVQYNNGYEFMHLKAENSMGAFAGTALRSVELPPNISYIGEQTFFECKSLQRIRIPNSVKKIDRYMFCRCESLEDVCLEEGIEEIGDRAFQQCPRLSKILIPHSVIQFGRGVFDIEEIYIQPRKRSYSVVAKKNKNITIICYSRTAALDFARKEGYPVKNAAIKNA